MRTSREQALLVQERHKRQQAEVLRKIGTTLSAVLDFDELLDLLIDQLALIMPDDSVEIFFIVEDVSHMVRQRKRPSLNIIRYDIADPDATTFTVAATRNHRRIITSGESLIIPDIQQYEGWQHTADIPSHFHGWAGVPLFANNKVRSILAVYSERIDAYHKQDVERLFAFARQAELAMQNAMLYQSTRQQLNELTALQELTALAAAATDVDALISQATAVIEKIFFTNNFGILLANANGTRLVLRSSYHSGEYDKAFSSISIDRGIAGYVFRTGKIVRTGDVTKNPHYVRVDDGTYSELCVPIQVDGYTLGVINVESAKYDAYTVGDERLMATIADQLATAVSRIHLLAQEKQRQQETETLRLAGNALVASLSLEDVLESILTELEKLVYFDSAGVLLLDGEHVLVAAGRGFSPQIHEALIGRRFSLDQSLVVRVVEAHAPVVIDDMRTEEGFQYWGGTTYIRGWMGAPLVARGEIIGFLTTDSRQVNVYGEQARQLVQAFANQAAIAIENARLYEAEKKARETAVILRKAAMKLSENRDLDMVMGQLLDFLAELITYDSANVMLLENNKLRHKALRGYEKWIIDVQLLWDIQFDIDENNGFSTIFKEGESYVINDTTIAPDWEETVTNGYIRNWLGVPLYAGGTIIGCISLDKSEPNFFTEEHVGLVENLAAQTAAILQNAILFKEMEAVGTLLRTLNATRRVIDSLPIIVPLVKDVVHCQFVSISILDDQERSYYTHYAVTEDENHPVNLERLRVSDTIVGNRIANGEIIYLPKLVLAISHSVEQARYRMGMRSRVLLPLIAGEDVIGSLNLGWAVEQGYDMQKISLFKRIASAIALAVERSDLYEQSRRQKGEIETLFSVSTTMRLAVTVSDILSGLTNYVETIVEPLFIRVLLAEASTGDLVTYRDLDGVSLGTPRRIPAGEGIGGHVFSTGKMYISAKLAEDDLVQILPRDLPYLSKLGGSITIPLQTQERTIGVIHIGLRIEHVLDESETRMLVGIAEIASSALDRVMVLETLEQRVDERTQALTIANQRLMELDQLKSKFVSDVSHELRTPITNLGLYVELMGRGNVEKQAYYLDVLRIQSERLKNLVEDILSLSRLERLKGEMTLTAVNVNNIISQAIQSKAILSKKGNLTLTATLQPDLPPALSDNAYMLQVILNLLTNAVNYTDEGDVEISTAIDSEDGMICITVTDSGMGIDEQDMPYIFDRFYRGHEIGSSSIPGTGLGLSIVQEVIAMYNGRLEIESEVGKGTTARVWLQQA